VNELLEEMEETKEETDVEDLDTLSKEGSLDSVHSADNYKLMVMAKSLAESRRDRSIEAKLPPRMISKEDLLSSTASVQKFK
jgi:hypothetical protein